MTLAGEIAARSPGAVRGSKDLFNRMFADGCCRPVRSRAGRDRRPDRYGQPDRSGDGEHGEARRQLRGLTVPMPLVTCNRLLAAYAEAAPIGRPSRAASRASPAPICATRRSCSPVTCCQRCATGDMVTIALPNSIDWFVAAAACWKLGAIPQPVSSRLPAAGAARPSWSWPTRASWSASSPARSPGRMCLPIGYVPTASIERPAPLPDVRPRRRGRRRPRAASTGRPKLIVSGDPARARPRRARRCCACDPTAAW